MIFDCHTHWGMCFAERDGRDPSAWLAVMDQYDVTHAIVLPHAGLVHAGRIAGDHDDLAAVCAASDGRMIAFVTTNPLDGDDGLAEIDRRLGDREARGVKFHPWLQGMSVCTPFMDEVCERAAAHGAPILFHDGTPPYSLPAQIGLLARRHPRTTIVLGHTGLFEYWREAIAVMNTADNLWACLCGPQLEGVRQVLARCDQTRLLWGSDFGFTLYDAVGYRLDLFRQAADEPTCQRILEDNPRRLLRWDA